MPNLLNWSEQQQNILQENEDFAAKWSQFLSLRWVFSLWV